jgi:hypothetical protein
MVKNMLSPRMSQEEIVRLQQTLKEVGEWPGVVDGHESRNLELARRRYEAVFGPYEDMGGQGTPASGKPQAAAPAAPAQPPPAQKTPQATTPQATVPQHAPPAQQVTPPTQPTQPTTGVQPLDPRKASLSDMVQPGYLARVRAWEESQKGQTAQPASSAAPRQAIKASNQPTPKAEPSNAPAAGANDVDFDKAYGHEMCTYTDHQAGRRPYWRAGSGKARPKGGVDCSNYARELHMAVGNEMQKKGIGQFDQGRMSGLLDSCSEYMIDKTCMAEGRKARAEGSIDPSTLKSGALIGLRTAREASFIKGEYRPNKISHVAVFARDADGKEYVIESSSERGGVSKTPAGEWIAQHEARGDKFFVANPQKLAMAPTKGPQTTMVADASKPQATTPSAQAPAHPATTTPTTPKVETASPQAQTPPAQKAPTQVAVARPRSSYYTPGFDG